GPPQPELRRPGILRLTAVQPGQRPARSPQRGPHRLETALIRPSFMITEDPGPRARILRDHETGQPGGRPGPGPGPPGRRQPPASDCRWASYPAPYGVGSPT